MVVQEMAAPGAALVEPAVRDFAAGLRGVAIGPDDAGYDAARRVWNGMIDRYPALVVRAAAVGDVIAAIRFAREHDLVVAVRGGGHNVAGFGTCDGGLVIDLSLMKGIAVDPEGRVARAEPGCLLGDLDRATQVYGLAVPAGLISHTGIAGLTLGGGVGWLMRKFGLTVDNLLAVELVTAEGEVVRASATERPDLFWAVRGGGGNFGIVTAFEYRLHPVRPEVLAGLVIYPMAQARDAMRFGRDLATGAPDELGLMFAAITAPPAAPFPEELWGRPVFAVGVCYAGSVAEGEAVVRPLRGFGAPALDLVRPMPYAALQAISDPSAPHGRHYWEKSGNLRALDDDAIDAFLARGAEPTSPLSGVQVSLMGGAVSRVPIDATAFAHRDAAWIFTAIAAWDGDDPAPARHVAWARGFEDVLAPWATGGVYVNAIAGEGADRVRAAYPPATYARLARIKAEYDPTNVFRLNQNIAPAR